jgi:hypothetical protein
MDETLCFIVEVDAADEEEAREKAYDTDLKDRLAVDTLGYEITSITQIDEN